MLSILKNHQINKYKWDSCIKNASNKLIYGYSWYLDVVSPGWEAIVKDDYEYIMPLPVKKIFGVKYLVQPVFTKQISIYSAITIEQPIQQLFFDLLYEKFSYVRIGLFREAITQKINGALIEGYNNHEINLNLSNSDIKKKYKRRAHRNIKRARENNLVCKKDIVFEDFINFTDKNSGTLGAKEAQSLKLIKPKLLKVLGEYLDALYYSAYNKQNELVSTIVFIIDDNRLYSLISASNEAGKKSQALYFLLDQFIDDFAGDSRMFDFTGSNMKGVAHFMESLGAEPFKYQFVNYKKPKSIFSLLK